MIASRRLLIILILTLAVAGAAGAAIFFAAREDSGAGVGPAPKFTPTSHKVAQCERGEQVCLGKALANISFKQGPQPALEQLDSLIERGDVSGSNCHQLSHDIGFAATARYRGNYGRAIAVGSAQCAGGYYHGVLFQAFINAGSNLEDEIARFCDEGSKDFRTICAHGVGHGSLVYYNYDAAKALPMCESLTSKLHTDRCVGGVFMEAFQPSDKVNRFERANEPFHPCPSIADEYKAKCYDKIMLTLRGRHREDWQAISNVCASAESGYVDDCRRSLGRHIGSKASRTRAADSLQAACSTSGADEGGCLGEAAYQYLKASLDPEGSVGACASPRTETAAACYGKLVEDLPALNLETDVHAGVCAALPEAWRAKCPAASS